MRKLLIFVFLLSFVCLSALDTICKISGEEFQCKVVGTIGNQLIYKIPNDNEKLRSISKYEISYFKYEDGKMGSFRQIFWENTRRIFRPEKGKLFIFAGFRKTYPKSKIESSSYGTDISEVSDNGLILGIKWEIRIANFFSLAPELSYSKKNFKTEFDVSSGMGLTYLKVSETVNQIQIPILFEIQTDYFSDSKYSPYFALGPQINYTTSHKFSYETKEERIDGFTAPNGDFKTFTYDFVLNSGVNIKTDNYFVNSVDFSLRYCFGLTKSNISGTGLTPGVSTKLNSLFLTIGVEL